LNRLFAGEEPVGTADKLLGREEPLH
jgi:hypothetical protein